MYKILEDAVSFPADTSSEPAWGRSLLGRPQAIPVKPRWSPGHRLYQADALEGHISVTDSRASLEKKSKPPIHPVP